MTGAVSVQRVTALDYLDDLAETLTLAFDRDPHMNWYVRQSPDRTRRLNTLFRLILTELLQDGELYATPDLKGVAIWFPPGTGKLSLVKQLQMLPVFLGLAGWRLFPGRAIGINRQELHRPKRPHVYLQLIGVHPDYRSKGYASALMQPFVGYADEHKIDAFLDTANPQNMVFYEKYGFVLDSVHKLPGRLTLYSMLRRAVTNQGE